MQSISLFFIVLVCVASLSTAQQKNTTFSKVQSSPSDKVTAKAARSEFQHHGGYEHHFPHHFGGHMGGYGHFKEFEHYLLPLLLVLGLGVLVMPMIGVLMTTLVGNVPVTTLVSGRKRRDLGVTDEMEKKILELWGKFEKAVESFQKEY